ncbi:MAG: ArsR/SmtB family transcription factor [Alphaproteobacteria bacterium]
MRNLEIWVETLKALADPTRLRLLRLCGEEELTVSDLTEVLGQSQPRVSRHLRVLQEAGLLERTRDGVYAYFRLTREALPRALVQQALAGVLDSDPEWQHDIKRLKELNEQRLLQAEQFFKNNASEWDRIRALMVPDSLVENAIEGLLVGRLPGDMLDIGTGAGRMLSLFGQRLRSGLGIDLSREMLNVARSHLAREGLEHCVVRQGDMCRLSLPDHSFDVVIIHMALHYAAKPLEAISEAARVLRPTGLLIVVDFAPHNQQYLQTTHGHRWMGFLNNDMQEWLENAGMVGTSTTDLAGDKLNVVVWAAVRKAE